MLIKISDELFIYEKTDLNEEEQCVKENEIIEFVQKTAKNYAFSDVKLSPIWDQEYRLWLRSSDGIHEIRLQEIDGRITQLTIDHKPFMLHEKGIKLLHRWLYGGQEPQLSLSGNSFEKVHLAPTSCQEDIYWDDWKKDSYIEGVHHNLKTFYCSELYPLVCRYLNLLISNGCTILELCAGDGSLANLILKQNSSKISKYILIDRNKASIEISNELLKPFIVNNQVEVHLSDLTRTSLQNYIYSVDIVLGVGALTRTVLARSDAVHVFEQIASLIKPGGYLMLTGVDDQWIDSEIMKKAGFCIKNMMVPNTLQQFYVAQKIS